MIGQGDLFDQRAALAQSFLGEAVFCELLGMPGAAITAGNEANRIDAELRRSCGLPATFVPVSL